MAIEAGEINSFEVRTILEKALHPMLAKGIDTVVLGCTHFPFVIPLIEEIVGAQVRVIDPAPAVARQVRRLLEAHGQLSSREDPGQLRFLTTGDAGQMEALLPKLIGKECQVYAARWDAGQILY
jgi:glutamate racemase